MKSIEELEKISFEELENAADDMSADVPESLGREVEAALIAAAAVGRSGRKSVKTGFYASAAVLSAAAVCLAVFFSAFRQPADTFDDPYLAYVELEKTFAYISQKVDRGMEIADQAEPVFDKTKKSLDIE